MQNIGAVILAAGALWRFGSLSSYFPLAARVSFTAWSIMRVKRAANQSVLLSVVMPKKLKQN
jgi:hypothetical protein